MKLVLIESPYAGYISRNIPYARAALKDSLNRGEAPLASHLLYTQPGILDDGDAEQRALGIAAGLAWRHAAELSAFYTDHGWSNGMLSALKLAHDEGRGYRLRNLYGVTRLPPMGSISREIYAAVMRIALEQE